MRACDDRVQKNLRWTVRHERGRVVCKSRRLEVKPLHVAQSRTNICLCVIAYLEIQMHVHVSAIKMELTFPKAPCPTTFKT